MIRRTLIAVVLAVSALTGSAPVPTAAYGGCVTRAEYRRAHQYDTMSQVHRKFGTNGFFYKSRWIDGYKVQVRGYVACDGSSGVGVGYVRISGVWYMLTKKWVW